MLHPTKKPRCCTCQHWYRGLDIKTKKPTANTGACKFWGPPEFAIQTGELVIMGREEACEFWTFSRRQAKINAVL